MKTNRTRWGALLSAGALTLALTACGGDAGADGADGGGQGVADLDVSAGEEVTTEEFMTLLKSPGDDTLSSYTMSMSMDIGSQSMSMDGKVDIAGGKPAFDMEMSLPGMGEAHMIMIDGQLFMSMPGVTQDGKFMEVPADQLGDIAGQLDEVDVSSTWKAWEKGATKILFIGDEDVDGESMSRFKINVDTDAVLEANGKSGPGAAEASAIIGDEIVYDVWIDGDNLMRKVSFVMQGVVTEMLADNWGESQDITAPAKDEIQQGGLSTDS